MNINSRVTLGIRNFFKKYGKIIFAIFIIWLIVFLINIYLKNNPKQKEAVNTYTPDNPVMDTTSAVPTKYKEKVNTIIKNFFDYCNSKNYDDAYKMLTDECKEYLYGDDIEYFKKYVDNIYTETKTYNAQNFSNVGNCYIYNIMILNDIESTGTTDGYNQYKEKWTIIKDGDDFKIANQGYIGKQSYKSITEDEYMKVKITSKDMSYTKEGYNLTITNKTDGYIVIADDSISKEVTLNLGDQKRGAVNTSNATFYISPNETKEMTFIFDKYYDDGKDPTEINLNAVRVLNAFNSESTDTTKEASKYYSFNITLKK